MSLWFGCAFNLTSFSEALQNKAAALWQPSAHKRLSRRERERKRKEEKEREKRQGKGVKHTQNKRLEMVSAD